MTSNLRNSDSFTQLDREAQVGNWRLGWVSGNECDDEFDEAGERLYVFR